MFPAMSEPVEPAAWADALVEMLGAGAAEDAPELGEALRATLAAASESDLATFFERLRTTGERWDYCAPHPLARQISRVVMRAMLAEGSGLCEGAALEGVRERPLVLVGNHLSFVDANVFEHLLHEGGWTGVAERLVVVVGPKVFTSPLRRVASLCFGTIKTPQSSSIASGEAVMSPRDVARTASGTLATARARLSEGAALLVFVEGTRSRSGRMQRALAGVARYLDRADAAVVPFGISGSEHLAPLESEEHLRRARVEVRLGAPLEAARLIERCGRQRAQIMDVLGFRIATCLPPEKRGVYAGADLALDEARKLSAEEF
jgi:1-acyl-sn-glycerol-3-phosphate acyltransferase